MKKTSEILWYSTRIFTQKNESFFEVPEISQQFFSKIHSNFFRKRNYFFYFFVQYLKKWFDFFWFYIFFISIFFKNMLRFSPKMISLFLIFVRYFLRKWNHFLDFLCFKKYNIDYFFTLFFYGWFIYIDSFCSLSIRKIAIKPRGHMWIKSLHLWPRDHKQPYIGPKHPFCGHKRQKNFTQFPEGGHVTTRYEKVLSNPWYI